MGSRFFVSSSATNWDNTSAWSLTSGGVSGASVPGTTDVAYFDASGLGTCTINAPVDIAGLRFDPEYSGTVQQSSTITIGEDDASFCGGTFLGGSQSLTINGSAHFCGTEFRSTSGTLTIRDGFIYEIDQSGTVIPQQIVVEELTLTAQNVSDKFVTLSDFPGDSTNVVVNVIGGGSQEYGSDYYVNNNELIWSGLDLDGLLAPGDILRVMYENAGPRYPGFFFHNNGTLQLAYSSDSFSGGGIELYNLKLQDGSGYRQIDSSCVIRKNAEFYEGYLADGVDATMHFEGDMTCQPTFGRYGSGEGVTFLFDGSNQQMLLNYTGAVLPTIRVNKQTSNQLKATGYGPLRIAGDLEVTDGTFNTNGLNLLVGVEE